MKLVRKNKSPQTVEAFCICPYSSYCQCTPPPPEKCDCGAYQAFTIGFTSRSVRGSSANVDEHNGQAVNMRSPGNV